MRRCTIQGRSILKRLLLMQHLGARIACCRRKVPSVQKRTPQIPLLIVHGNLIQPFAWSRNIARCSVDDNTKQTPCSEGHDMHGSDITPFGV